MNLSPQAFRKQPWVYARSTSPTTSPRPCREQVGTAAIERGELLSVGTWGPPAAPRWSLTTNADASACGVGRVNKTCTPKALPTGRAFSRPYQSAYFPVLVSRPQVEETDLQFEWRRPPYPNPNHLPPAPLRAPKWPREELRPIEMMVAMMEADAVAMSQAAARAAEVEQLARRAAEAIAKEKLKDDEAAAQVKSSQVNARQVESSRVEPDPVESSLEELANEAEKVESAEQIDAAEEVELPVGPGVHAMLGWISDEGRGRGVRGTLSDGPPPLACLGSPGQVRSGSPGQGRSTQGKATQGKATQGKAGRQGKAGHSANEAISGWSTHDDGET